MLLLKSDQLVAPKSLELRWGQQRSDETSFQGEINCVPARREQPEFTILHRAAQPEFLYQQIKQLGQTLARLDPPLAARPPVTTNVHGCRSAIIVNCEQRYHRLSRAVLFETKATKLPLDSVKRHGARFILLESSAQKSVQHVIPTAYPGKSDLSEVALVSAAAAAAAASCF